MKSRFLLLSVAAVFAAVLTVQAQSATKPAVKPAAAVASSAVKLPPNVPPAHGIVKTAMALKYQDIRIGTGPEGEEKQLWKVKYTGWRAADGVMFDAWDKHPQPVLGPDGKPVMGPDGKPKMGDPQPMEFPHGIGRMIPGFDLGVEGMRVGGKRRIFVPWALAYGFRAIPDRGPDHPGIPAKSDLIFDVELVAVNPLPAPPQPPAPGAITRPVPQPGAPGAPGQPAAPATAPAPGTAPATAPTTPPVPQPKPATPPGK
jgi:peptidylprolyl isomerase